MITNKKVIKDLLNSKNASKNDIVLGRAFFVHKEKQINEMVKDSIKNIYVKSKNKEDLV